MDEARPVVCSCNINTFLIYHHMFIRFKQFLALLSVAIAFSILPSCNQSPDAVYADTEEFDRVVFGKISEMAEQSTQVWDSYDYLKSYPVYLIFTDDSGNSARGYLINPREIPDGSVKVDPAHSRTLQVYRNDTYFSAAEATLDGGLFAFEFDLEGENHFLMRYQFFENFYNNFKNVDNNFIPLVMAHEMFHMYQIDNWQEAAGWTQDLANYPMDEDMIALHLLLFDLMEASYSANSAEEQLQYLKYYVSIRTEMARLDQTEDRLVTSMGTYQELIEGTARYVEHFTAAPTIYPSIGDDPTHGWGNFLDNVSNRSTLRTALVFRIWYHVGAGVTRLLVTNGVDVEQSFSQAKTPFTTASEYLDLNGEELTTYLAEAKTAVDWPAYQQRAKMLAELP